MINQLQQQLLDVYTLPKVSFTKRSPPGMCLKKTETIFAGGGDGTIVDVINGLHVFRGTPPTVGVLRLGTGNAPAYWLNSSKPSEDLKRWEHPRQALSKRT